MSGLGPRKALGMKVTLSAVKRPRAAGARAAGPRRRARTSRFDQPAAGLAAFGGGEEPEKAAPSGRPDAAAEEAKARRKAKLEAWKARKKKRRAEEGGPGADPLANAADAGNGASAGDVPRGVEVDPLDAFMSSLDGVAEQEGMSAATGGLVAAGAGGTAGPAGASVSAGAAAVSLEDIMAGNVPDAAAAAAGAGDGGGGVGSGGVAASSSSGGGDGQPAPSDEDFHAAFMESLRKQREDEEAAATARAELERQRAEEQAVEESKATSRGIGRLYGDQDDDALYDGEEWGEQKSALDVLKDKLAKKDLKQVNHDEIDYIDFRKKFYIQSREITAMSDEDVVKVRKDLDIKVRGKHCPRPIEHWYQSGLSDKLLLEMEKNGYSKPFAIQRQALPAVMNGRDVIGIAKTGSGKTLAFLLPMIRHVLDQPKLQPGDGPIALIMAPARELAVQIFTEAKKLCKSVGIRATAVYGGASVGDQIANMKRGAEVVVCTPGRMIDILTMNAGRVIALSRVTYVVLDEADRMFDMGFEPQIAKIIGNVRPDRQTMLFSATFPSHVESLAKKVLKKPVEIIVGGRSVTAGEIEQHVEVVTEGDKFRRLLQLLGVWYDKGNILVFVDTQQKCDYLFQELLKAGYRSLSLHGGKDQFDREQTILDFKKKLISMLVSTSVGGRGLDVKGLVLVINYCVPNHLEDYVHRVGRTGRAGAKGTSYTFITPDEGQYAGDIVKALQDAKQDVPEELAKLSDAHKEAISRGEARKRRSGYSTRGFKFNEKETEEKDKIKKMHKKRFESEAGIESDDSDQEGMDAEDAKARELEKAMYKEYKANEAAKKEATAALVIPEGATAQEIAILKAQHEAAKLRATKLAPAAPVGGVIAATAAAKRAVAAAEELQRKLTGNTGSSTDVRRIVSNEVEINDYPQKARWRVTHKDAMAHVTDFTGCAVTAKGSFIPPGRKPNQGERKLYLLIEGPSEAEVRDAMKEVRRILEEATLEEAGRVERGQYGKYKVV